MWVWRMNKLRRNDRAVNDDKKIEQIIASCHCMRIGFHNNGQVYIVPLNYGYEFVNGTYVFYFHSAKEGRKIELIQSSPYVGFEMDTNYKIYEDDIACNYAARFQSIIGNGYVSIIDDPEEKKHGLTMLMKQNTGNDSWNFDNKMVNAVCVFKLVVEQLSCKEHK